MDIFQQNIVTLCIVSVLDVNVSESLNMLRVEIDIFLGSGKQTNEVSTMILLNYPTGSRSNSIILQSYGPAALQ